MRALDAAKADLVFMPSVSAVSFGMGYPVTTKKHPLPQSHKGRHVGLSCGFSAWDLSEHGE